MHVEVGDQLRIMQSLTQFASPVFSKEVLNSSLKSDNSFKRNLSKDQKEMQ